MMTSEAKEYKKNFTGGPTDPELTKASAGMGALAVQGITLYPVPNPLPDYEDAVATGRCKILCCDLGGTTLAVANLYGWTGGVEGSKEAARTDDLISIVRMQRPYVVTSTEASMHSRTSNLCSTKKDGRM